MVILTIGHSTYSLKDFIHILKLYGAKRVVDIRTVPRSRHNPQFNRDTLPEHLTKAGIGYVHMPGLGGLRHPLPDSVNKGWRNASFRGFADYMQTEEFSDNLRELIGLAEKKPVVLMCAEALPWRCHRSLIADALSVIGIEVEHIMSATNTYRHKLTPWAKVSHKRITYPEETNQEAIT
jgi:uncharacterized protein (DUF488 family)